MTVHISDAREGARALTRERPSFSLAQSGGEGWAAGGRRNGIATRSVRRESRHKSGQFRGGKNEKSFIAIRAVLYERSLYSIHRIISYKFIGNDFARKGKRGASSQKSLLPKKHFSYFWKRDVIFNLFMDLSLDILLMLSTGVHFFLDEVC